MIGNRFFFTALCSLCVIFLYGCHKEPGMDYYRKHINQAKTMYEKCKKMTPDERYEMSGCTSAAKSLNTFYWDKSPKSLEK